MTPRPHRNPQDDTRNTLLADLEAERHALQARIDALDRAMQALTDLRHSAVAEDRPRYGALEPPKRRAASKFRYFSALPAGTDIDTIPGTPQLRLALRAIAEAGATGATQGDVVKRTGVPSGSLGWLLDLLRKRGLVTVASDR